MFFFVFFSSSNFYNTIWAGQRGISCTDSCPKTSVIIVTFLWLYWGVDFEQMSDTAEPLFGLVSRGLAKVTDVFSCKTTARCQPTNQRTDRMSHSRHDWAYEWTSGSAAKIETPTVCTERRRRRHHPSNSMTSCPVAATRWRIDSTSPPSLPIIVIILVSVTADVIVETAEICAVIRSREAVVRGLELIPLNLGVSQP